MTKYDDLDPRRALEQTITGDLKLALKKRGFQVWHNGSPTKPAPRDKPDIETSTKEVHINVEVTKTTKSSADREMLSVADHLTKIKASHPAKRCFAIYVSPETHYRMINAIRDFNVARETERDMKIMPLCFSNLELVITKLIPAHRDVYTKKQILSLFERYRDFVDDERVLRVLYEKLFPTDANIKRNVENKEITKWQQLERQVIHDLKEIENRLRESGIAVAGEAIRNLIYLVFIKLYEEKKSIDGRGKNYFQPKTFLEFQEAQGEKETKRAIHKLFDQIKSEREFQETGLFTEHDLLAEKLADDFVLEQIIKPLDRYAFYKTKVDGLGAVYEVLALRSSKDVKVGQFFTPANVVNFMVELAELDPADVALDPACGTGRFLIWAMDDMVKKVPHGRNEEEKRKHVRLHQLFGTDIDMNVAKLAKMNMYIHGDGKGNIYDDDGLLLYKTRDTDGKVDVILTNPPLGRMNYRRPEYAEDFYKRMELIPRTVQSNEEEEEEEITGNLMKGGALFLNACFHYLKSAREPKALPEWRGGKLVTVLDEGILNLDDYAPTREFVKKHFYIKAIISLTKDTFIPVSHTPNKTSILYAIKKDDETAKQQEPIFFAHAEKVGMTTKRKPCPNHLENVLEEYFKFKKLVFESYDGFVFNKHRFEELGFKGGVIGE